MFGFLKKLTEDDTAKQEIVELQSKIEELTEEIKGRDEVIARLVDREKTRIQEERHPLINSWEDLKKIENAEPMVSWLQTRDYETVAIVLRSVNQKVGEQLASAFSNTDIQTIADIMKKMPPYTMKDTKIKRIYNKMQDLYA